MLITQGIYYWAWANHIHCRDGSCNLQPPDTLPSNGLATVGPGPPHATQSAGPVQLNNIHAAGDRTGSVCQFGTIFAQQPMLAGRSLGDANVTNTGAVQIMQGQAFPQGTYIPQARAPAATGMVHLMTDGVPVASAVLPSGEFVVGGL